MDPFSHSHVHRDGYTYALVCKYAKIVHSSPYNFDYSFLEVLPESRQHPPQKISSSSPMATVRSFSLSDPQKRCLPPAERAR